MVSTWREGEGACRRHSSFICQIMPRQESSGNFEELKFEPEPLMIYHYLILSGTKLMSVLGHISPLHGPSLSTKPGRRSMG